jgi:hypothetical protein
LDLGAILDEAIDSMALSPVSGDNKSSKTDGAINKKRLLAELSLSTESSTADTSTTNNSMLGRYATKPININVPLTPRYTTTLAIGPNNTNQKPDSTTTAKKINEPPPNHPTTSNNSDKKPPRVKPPKKVKNK